jgi:hypothetical protein
MRVNAVVVIFLVLNISHLKLHIGNFCSTNFYLVCGFQTFGTSDEKTEQYSALSFIFGQRLNTYSGKLSDTVTAVYKDKPV